MDKLWKLRLPSHLSLLVAVVLLAAAPASAQQPGQSPPMAGMRSAGGSGSPMMKVMDKMQRAMAAAPQTGNIDHDFVVMMIPHHQGAIDMAKIELARGKDPMLRRMARHIITSQEHEIREMKEWKARHPVDR